MSELKPCPFCGYEAEISIGRFDGKATSYVMCKRCGARGEFFFVSPKYASDDRAIKAWNRRTGEQGSEKPEITEEDVKEFCRKRCLHIVTNDFFDKMMERSRG